MKRGITTIGTIWRLEYDRRAPYEPRKGLLMSDQFPSVIDYTDPPEVQQAVASIFANPLDDESVALEASLLERTDNGWVEGDPEDQPDQGV
jgi:hypothetical protein